MSGVFHHCIGGRARENSESAGLSPREREVLDLLVECGNNKQIARRLGISEISVKCRLTTCFEKAGVGSDRVLLAIWWDRQNRSKAA